MCLIIGSALSIGVTRSYYSEKESTSGNTFIAAAGFETTETPSAPTETPTPTPTEEVPAPEATSTPTPTQAPTVSTLPWINEIHYDNSSTDTFEGLEIAGPAGLDLTGWKVVFYNGNGGASYDTLDLTGSIPNQQAGYGTLWFAQSEIQNGEPDGLALVSPASAVVQFLSYEGSFIAADGPALGMNSIDIGVDEDPAPPEGQSLQLTGSGNEYSEFTWAGPSIKTEGAVNTNQTFN